MGASKGDEIDALRLIESIIRGCRNDNWTSPAAELQAGGTPEYLSEYVPPGLFEFVLEGGEDELEDFDLGVPWRLIML